MKADTKWTIVAASGGMTLGGEHDHLFPWLKSVFSFLGVVNTQFHSVKGTLFPSFDISQVAVPQPSLK